MVQLLADRRDVDFVLHEQLEIGNLSKHEKFGEFNSKTVDLIVSEARSLANKEVVPTNVIGDTQGCRLEKGHVILPDEFKKVWDLYCEGEWVAMSESPEWGGQGMPKTLYAAATEYLNGANCALYMYVALTHGAASMIEAFGTQEQKDTYIRKMNAGSWGGTMLLTEPNAGSDVGALETVAKKNPDGTYSITGNKIFISGGEHEMCENIVHPVLARIEGAPKGSRGISLFLVPKYRVNDDGSPGEFNDVVCTGLEHKMGISGSCTCSLSLGGSGNCVGTLLGEENKGLKVMFHLMNDARFYVGLQGLSLASSSLANAADYAKKRIQGPNLLHARDPEPKSVSIMEHPDVRRQLSLMKVYTEGMRSIIYYVAWCQDQASIAKTPEDAEKYKGIVDLLIPIAKGYVTDRAFEVCSHGVQVLGGYGYTEEFPQAQLLRDCRITMIYEGTNGIQAMDLLGRKLGLGGGKPLMNLAAAIQKTVDEGKGSERLKDLALDVERLLNKVGEAAMFMGGKAMSPDVMKAFAHATPFMEILGDLVMAWMHLWRALVAEPKVEKKKKDRDFYLGQITSAEFFIRSEVPVTFGKIESLLALTGAALEMPDSSFK